MNFEWMQQLFNFDFWMGIVNQMKSLGPLVGILLPIIEAIFPPLPLSLFVTLNVAVFGFWSGYLYSWIGSCIGSILVFLVIKRLGKSKVHKIAGRHEKVEHILKWIKEKGFTAVFVLLTFPFTPSIVVCSVAALAGLKEKQYIAAVLFGKLIMILSLSFIGVNITSFFENPVKSTLLIAITLSISFIAKKIISVYEKKITVEV